MASEGRGSQVVKQDAELGAFLPEEKGARFIVEMFAVRLDLIPVAQPDTDQRCVQKILEAEVIEPGEKATVFGREGWRVLGMGHAGGKADGQRDEDYLPKAAHELVGEHVGEGSILRGLTPRMAKKSRAL